MSKRIFVLLCAFILATALVFSACSSDSDESSVSSYESNDDRSTENSDFSENGEDSNGSSAESSPSIETSDDTGEESSDGNESVIIPDDSSVEDNSEIPYAETYERDRKIYTDYLLKTNYKELIDEDETMSADFSIESLMHDLNNDGVHELLIDIYNPDQDWTHKTVLTIKNNVPEILISYLKCLGSDWINLHYDVKNNHYAICVGSGEASADFSAISEAYYISDNLYSKPAFDLYYELITKNEDNAELIEEVKNTIGIYEETEDAIIVYKLNGSYVTGAQANEVFSRFEYIDYDDRAYDETSYNNPILSWEERTSY